MDPGEFHCEDWSVQLNELRIQKKGLPPYVLGEAKPPCEQEKVNPQGELEGDGTPSNPSSTSISGRRIARATRKVELIPKPKKLLGATYPKGAPGNTKVSVATSGWSWWWQPQYVYKSTHLVSSGTHLSSIILIVRRLVASLSQTELLKCRLVSRRWNEEIVRLLTITPNPSEYNLNGELVSYQGIPCDLSSIVRRRIGQRTLWNLQHLLNHSEYPELLLKVLKLSDQLIERYKAFQNYPCLECKKILEDFGHHVKHLTIVEKAADLSILNSLWALGKTYCPNVEVLNYFITGRTSVFFFPPKFEPHRKLKEVRFHSSVEFGSSEQVSLLYSILQCAPQLSRLHLQSDNSLAMEGFFTLMQILPQVTNNLTELSIHTRDFSHLKQLAKCEFTGYLNTLKFCYFLNGFENVQNHRHRSEADLMRFLKLIGNSLEHLEIQVRDENPVPTSYPTYLNDLPGMPNLKVLSVPHCIVRSIQEMEYLRTVPSLRHLKIYSIENSSGVGLTQLVNSLYKSKFVHNNMEHIHCEVGDSFMTRLTIPSAVIPLLKEVLPRVTQLRINCMDHQVPHNGKGVQPVSFLESFRALCLMENLQLLEIDLSGIENTLTYPLLDFNLALRHLKEAPTLKTLIFYHSSGPLYELPTEASLLKLLEADRLRTLHFYGFAIGKEKEYEAEGRRIWWKEIKPQFLKWPKIKEQGMGGNWVMDYYSHKYVEMFAERKMDLVIQRGLRVGPRPSL